MLLPVSFGAFSRVFTQSELASALIPAELYWPRPSLTPHKRQAWRLRCVEVERRAGAEEATEDDATLRSELVDAQVQLVSVSNRGRLRQAEAG